MSTPETKVLAAITELHGAFARALGDFLVARKDQLGAAVLTYLRDEISGNAEYFSAAIDAKLREILTGFEAVAVHHGLRLAELARDVRDEDVAVESVKAGDRMVVSTTILREWIENGGASVAVVVKEVRVDNISGLKTMTVEAAR